METRTRRRSILIVDDDAVTRDLLRDFFDEEGFDVRVAVDGVEALSLLGEFQPAVVMTDLEMPRLDGAGLIEELRSNHPGLRIVALTARVALDAKREAESLRVDGYINKPLDLDEILRCVEALL